MLNFPCVPFFVCGIRFEKIRVTALDLFKTQTLRLAFAALLYLSFSHGILFISWKNVIRSFYWTIAISCRKLISAHISDWPLFNEAIFLPSPFTGAVTNIDVILHWACMRLVFSYDHFHLCVCVCVGGGGGRSYLPLGINFKDLQCYRQLRVWYRLFFLSLWLLKYIILRDVNRSESIRLL